MKTILIFILSMYIGFCVAQTTCVKAHNDTLYFENSGAVYVPKYDVKVRYLDNRGKVVDIAKCSSGIYIKECSSENLNFKFTEFYTKSEKRKKQNKAWRFRQNQS